MEKIKINKLRSMIIYDSFFGNTEKIAHAIGNSFRSKADVQVFRVNEIKPEQISGMEILIVGSPTRAFRPSKPITRLLNRIPAQGLKNVKVLAFDTRISTVDANSRVLNMLVKWFGYGAKSIADLLEKKGGSLILSPEGFFVNGSEGPLKEGELERAAEWARQVVI
jgi:flavodoxin